MQIAVYTRSLQAALGCHVILVDPMIENLGRALESIRKLGALENATFFQNAVGTVLGRVSAAALF